MPKLEKGQIVWAWHPTQNIQWPAKVMQRVQRNDWQVKFFSKEGPNECFTVTQNACKDFQEYCVNEKEAKLELYDAYRIALKQYKMRPHDSSEDATLDQQTTTADLQLFLSELISGSLRGKQLAQSHGFCYQVREEETGLYLRQGFCQKINFLINEYPLNPELSASLKEIRKKMKEVLTKAFIQGDI